MENGLSAVAVRAMGMTVSTQLGDEPSGDRKPPPTTARSTVLFKDMETYVKLSGSMSRYWTLLYRSCRRRNIGKTHLQYWLV
jgi:hypothetical protein